MKLGLAIKSVRKQKGLNQSELARLINMSQTSLSQIENDVINPSPKTIKKICETLQIAEPVLYLIGIEDNDVPKEKKEMYNRLFPSLQNLALEILGANDLKTPQ